MRAGPSLQVHAAAGWRLCTGVKLGVTAPTGARPRLLDTASESGPGGSDDTGLRFGIQHWTWATRHSPLGCHPREFGNTGLWLRWSVGLQLLVQQWYGACTSWLVPSPKKGIRTGPSNVLPSNHSHPSPAPSPYTYLTTCRHIV